MSIVINADSARVLAAELSAQRKLIPHEVFLVTETFAEIMRSQAAAMAPVTNKVPGYAGTIRKKVKRTMMGVEATIESTSPFGYILEFGAGYSGPHPHFGPAFNFNKDAYESAVVAVAAKFL